MEYIDIKFVIFREELDLLWIIENQRSEKFWNEHFSENRRFQRYQNCQILICILRVIEPASQHPNSDWKWTVVGQALNWGVKW